MGRARAWFASRPAAISSNGCSLLEGPPSSGVELGERGGSTVSEMRFGEPCVGPGGTTESSASTAAATS